MQSSPKVIIIGAGVAALAAAIRLAVQGMKVTVYEKNSYPGGKLGQLEMNGYHFDEGPSLFTQPQNLVELFELAGEPIDDYFLYRPEAVSCNYFYEDGSVIHAYADAGLFEKELVEKNDEAPGSLSAYLKRSDKIYRNIGLVFLNYSMHRISSLFRAPVLRALASTRWRYLFNSMHHLNSHHFKNKKTIQLFDRYATYNGSNPYQAPGMLGLIAHLEHNEGVFYPKGGMISIAKALYLLALKKGVIFYFNEPVERIIRKEKKVMGVVVNGKNIYANRVVSNLDVYFTYQHLLKDVLKAKKILKQERSSSAMVFYWGIRQSFPQLGLHNIFFTHDYATEFKHLFSLKTMYDDPTIYVNITGKCEPGIQAPEGKENWFVMVNAPANTGQDWVDYREKYRMAVIQKLNRLLATDIEPLIEVEAFMDPVLIESRTASYRGSLYGTSSNSRMAAFLRHPNFTDSIRGLYFAGGSVHPGGGIPLCLQSAKIMCQLMIADLKRDTGYSP